MYPRVFTNIRESRIRGVVNALKICTINKVDMVLRKDKSDKEFNKVYIHVDWWDNETANNAQARLREGKDVKIVYDDPWFWKVSAYRKSGPVRPRAKLIVNSVPEEPKTESNVELNNADPKTETSTNKVCDEIPVEGILEYGGNKGLPVKRRPGRK